MDGEYTAPKLNGCLYYTLDEHNRPVQEPDLLKWAVWYETHKRHLGNDRVDDVRVSTIFLGLDHSFVEDSPVLWKTMVFGGEFDQMQERYYCYEDAVNGHERWLEKVRGSHAV